MEAKHLKPEILCVWEGGGITMCGINECVCEVNECVGFKIVCGGGK